MVIEMRNKLRVIYGVLFLVILIIEIFIAVFVRDSFVRPYIGDMLVTVLICSFARFLIPEKIKLLPIFVLIFSTLVEIGQYFDFVKIIGLDGNVFVSTIIGRTFSVADLICYAIGCVVFAIFDCIIKKENRSTL